MEVREVITAAARAAVLEHRDAWLLAALSDYSFEEGTRNRYLRPPVEAMERVGAPVAVLADVRSGINGMLQHELEAMAGVSRVTRHKSRVPDLAVTFTSGAVAALEVKLLYDLTYVDYYPKAAHDRVKLAGLRSSAPELHAYQIVYCVQLPSLDYPSGRWYGKTRVARSRQRQVIWAGIDAQLHELRSCVADGHGWPQDGPERIALDDGVDQETVEAAMRWYAECYVPSVDWSLSAEHLRGAAAGVLVWPL